VVVREHEAAIGVVALTVFRSQSRWRFTVLYLVLGWVALAVLPALIDSGGMRLVALILLGGLFYSAGAVVYARKRPDSYPRWFGSHEVFHACTIAAFLAHYIAVSIATRSA
jgi:hemolysin III